MTIRWGIWGTTTIAREWMINAIRACGGEIVAVCGRDPDRTAAYAAENSIPSSFDNSTDFLLSDIDAVYIGTINSFHHEQVIASAAAKKHVMCEKPLAITLAASKEMVEACTAANVILAVNHHLRNAAPHVEMKRVLLEGCVGEIVSLAISHGGYLPNQLQGWRINDESAGSGVILDLTVHDADLLHFLLEDEPESVFAMSKNTGLANPGIEDSVMGAIRFKNGVTASFFDAFTTPHAQLRLEVHGTEASLIACNSFRQTPGGRLVLRNSFGEQELMTKPRNLYEPNIDAFHNAITGDGQPIATGTDGLRSVAVALAAKQSIQSGATVHVSY